MNDKKIVLCKSILDGIRNQYEKHAIYIENGKIARIAPMNDADDYEEYEVIDFSDKYVMPGMINTHVHIFSTPVANPSIIKNEDSDTVATIRALNHLGMYLPSGTTYIRDCGGKNHMNIGVKLAMTKGLLKGPGFITSGRSINMTGGHGAASGVECDGVAEARKAARTEIKAGAGFLKVMATGGVMSPGTEPGSPQLTVEEMKAIADEAHKVSKIVIAHAQGTQGIKNAIMAGIDSIEHGIYLDDEAIEMMKERGTWLVPTLSAIHNIVNNADNGIPEFAVKKAKNAVAAGKESLLKAYKAGVNIAAGTDSGTPFNLHGNTALEYKLMIEYGISPIDALTFLTINGARQIGVDNEYGSIEVGKYADIIAVNENPLENPDTLFNVEGVLKKGELFKI